MKVKAFNLKQDLRVIFIILIHNIVPCGGHFDQSASGHLRPYDRLEN